MWRSIIIWYWYNVSLSLILLNNLISHTRFWLSAYQITSYTVFVQIHKLNNKMCRSWSEAIWSGSTLFVKVKVVVNSRIRVNVAQISIEMMSFSYWFTSLERKWQPKLFFDVGISISHLYPTRFFFCCIQHHFTKLEMRVGTYRLNIFLMFLRKLVLLYSLEVPCRDASNENLQYMFSQKNKKNIHTFRPKKSLHLELWFNVTSGPVVRSNNKVLNGLFLLVEDCRRLVTKVLLKFDDNGLGLRLHDVTT